MTDQPLPTQPERSRTIPDGGLAASGLPDWMQAKPEWSARLVDTDHVVMDARPVPAPDTSTIDLANMLSTEDVPDWLREVSHRPVTYGDEQGRSATSTLLTSDADTVNVETVSITPVVQDAKPWWTSDRVMAGLLIAVVLTILFVLVTTIRMG